MSDDEPASILEERVSRRSRLDLRMPCGPLDPRVLLIAAVIYFGLDGVLGVSLFGERLREPAGLLASRLVTQPIIIAALLMLLVRFRYSPIECLGLKGSDAKRGLVWGVIFALATGPIIMGLSMFARAHFPVERVHPALVFLEEGGPWAWGVVIVNAVLLAPVGEELFFRGIAQNAIASIAGPPLAIVVTGVLFGAAHLSTWPDPIPLSLMGILLGLSFARTKTLWTPIVYHATFNGSMLALAALQSQRAP